MQVKRNGWAVAVPPGKYFLGDPCYAVPEEDWVPLLTSCGFFEDSPVGEYNGHKVLAFSTLYGDGTYTDQSGTEYPVDAGLIGLVPADYAVRLARCTYLPGRWVEFTREVYATDDLSGRLTFGTVIINTAD